MQKRITALLVLTLLITLSVAIPVLAAPAAVQSEAGSVYNQVYTQILAQLKAQLGRFVSPATIESLARRLATQLTGRLTGIPETPGRQEPKPVPAPQPEPAPAPAPTPAPELSPVPQPQPEPAPASPAGLSPDETHMLELVNQERVKAGLEPLEVDMRLVETARAKSRDMIENDYFGHISPTLGSPFDQMARAGIEYRYAGENLAGAPTVEQAHAALMKSPGHRANILSPNFTKIGIGIADGGPYGKMFTQQFIG